MRWLAMSIIFFWVSKSGLGENLIQEEKLQTQFVILKLKVVIDYSVKNFFLGSKTKSSNLDFKLDFRFQIEMSYLFKPSFQNEK